MKRFSIIITAILLAVSCMDEPVNLYIYSEDDMAINMSPKESYDVIEFAANGSWKASSSESWITVSPASGDAGNIKLAVYTEKNYTEKERQGFITVDVGGQSEKITVTQGILYLETLNYKLGIEGGEINVPVSEDYNRGWSLMDNAVGWIKVKFSNNNLVITVSQNESTEGREGNLIVYIGYDKEINVSIIQEGIVEIPEIPIDISTYVPYDNPANCYIVSKSGKYKFRPNKGNSYESVGEVVSAEVLWESFGTDVAPNVGDLVTNASYHDGWIIFSVPDDFKEGNAVIAARDEKETILWSWHIWLTDQPEDQIYNNNAGTMMDRNLGAVSATPGDLGALGLLYQWGRKDPFLSKYSVFGKTFPANSTIDWPYTEMTNSTYGTIEFTISHPTKFLYSCWDDSMLYDQYDDWFYDFSDLVYKRWQSVKTIYDPCPAGYRVPDGGENGVWSRAMELRGSVQVVYDDVNNGLNLGSDNSVNFTSNSSVCWYPSAGLYIGSHGSVYDSFSYWSCTGIESRVSRESYTIQAGGEILTLSTSQRNYMASPVRCLKENTSSDPEPTMAINLSKNETANSYIVSKSGYYQFSTVQGNTSISVGDVVSADVLWESFGTNTPPNVGDLVYDVKYSDNTITFKASDREGNALIAAKDADGNILWSWHIWLTDKPEDHVYKNNAGTMMDRNLGATSTIPGAMSSIGLFYQWGRKDPFLRTNQDLIAGNKNGTIEYVTAHPTTFIKCFDNWHYTEDGSTDMTLWQSNKTIYDPCPVGYRVPDGGEDGVWSKASGKEYLNDLIYDSINDGINFGKNNALISLTDVDDCWYPSAGCLSWEGEYTGLGYGYYWSCTPKLENKDYHVYSLDFQDRGEGYGSFYPSGFSSRSGANSVRCMKE